MVKLKEIFYLRVNKQNISFVLIVLFVSLLGFKILFSSHAFGPYTAVEAESGALTSQATIQSDVNASGGKFVNFGSTINPIPTGPVTPSSGWHVDFADDFNAPLGTSSGEDNFWYPENQNGNNKYETEINNSNQVSVSNGNLVITAKYENDVAPADPSSETVQRNYVSGQTTTTTSQSGYKGFTWTPGNGSTWAFEINAQWPIDPDGNLFNAWWSSSQNGWVNERDFFEGHDTSKLLDSDWIYQTNCTNSPSCTGAKLQDYYTNPTLLSFDPSTAMHRYTYVIYPDQSWSFYIDGVLQTWVGNNGISQAETSDNVPMLLILNYALDKTTFTTGTRQFIIDSVAVYQDEAHAGQGVTGGGIAPATVIGSN